MVAEIISIGDELLIGQVVNTNAAWIARQLIENGIQVRYMTVIPDDRGRILDGLNEAMKRTDVIVLTGGLGPTRDDITKKALSDYFDAPLVLHQPTLDHIQELFGRRGIPVLDKNREQAMVPLNCTPLSNPYGTAPGLLFEKEGKIIVSLPGVPYEMEAIITGSVIPRLTERNDGILFYHRTVLTHGMGESMLSEKIGSWEDSLPENVRLAYLPQPGMVRLRLTAFGPDIEELKVTIQKEIERLQKLIPDLIFGYDTQTMEQVLGELLREKTMTISTAESCTGGYIAHLITSVAGSSDYFKGSVVAYDNEVKMKILGVDQKSLDFYGAVSEQVVKEMAEGATRRFNTDVALATSGIAGPGGGTKEKPVGLVWVGLAMPWGVHAWSFKFGDHRVRNIRRSSLAALNLLRMSVLRGDFK